MEIINVKAKTQEVVAVAEQEVKGTPSSLTLVNRNTLNISGVSKVKSTTDTQIVAVVGGSVLTVLGSGLTVKALSVETGALEINGNVSSLKYGGAGDAGKKPWYKKLLG
ncbi:MAG: hypothetical protein FWD32_02125 [Firmicutes bacterium]|nr:hypothetical protein [Bacillota bacterium]